MTETVANPFGEEPIDEVELTHAPLVTMLAQLRFPTIASFASTSGVADFQSVLRDTYPVMRSEDQVTATLASDGRLLHSEGGPVWVFTDVDPTWKVTLAPEWVSVDTASYSTRAEFISRWTRVLEALAGLGNPPAVYDRLGVRYVNRLTGDDATTELAALVNPAVLGALSIESGMTEAAELVGAVTNAHFMLDGPQLMARWGRLPAGAVVVPGVAPVNETSWMLDLDAFFSDSAQPFEVSSIVEASEHAALHAYRFFRWAMTNEFIRRRGGTA